MRRFLSQIRERRDRIFSSCRRKDIGSDEILLLYGEYTSLRNKINGNIRRAKKMHYTELFRKNKTSMKETWKIINELTGGRKGMKRINWERRFDETEASIAATFAQTFVQQVESLVEVCEPGPIYLGGHIKRYERLMFLPRIDLDTTRRILLSMDKKKAAGADGISVRGLVEGGDVVLPAITDLINASINSHCIPKELKVSVVTPVYKSGKKSVYNNYRPISVLPALDKIMERYVHTKVMDYLESNNLIDKHQYGFRRDRGTIQLLEDLNDLLTEKLNHRMNTLCMFVDFSKAFDTINRTKMVEALEAVGIRGTVREWMEDYLRDRRFSVKIGEKCSTMRKSERGVVQGSIMGPLMYVLYVNDMNYCFRKCQYFLYADDTIILSTHKSCEVALATLNEEFGRFQRWCHNKELCINAGKTKVMHIRTPHTKITTTIDIKIHTHECLHGLNLQPDDQCEAVECVESQRYLGVVLDSHLCWEPHITNIQRKLRHLAGRFYRLAEVADRQTNRMAYCALVESIVNYGITVWGGASDYLIKRLKRTQHSVVRSITPSGRAETKDYKECNILKIKEMFMFRVVTRNYFKTTYRAETEKNKKYQTIAAVLH